LTSDNKGVLFAPGDTDIHREEEAVSGNGKTFEENMARLELLVRQLERGELSLEDALVCYKEGVTLVGYCQQSLERTAKEVENLTDGLAGSSAEK